jgi:DNA-binding transcriptional LysR family regulator
LTASFEEALDLIDSTVRTSRGFDPRTAHRSFTVMASDYVLVLLLSPLVAELEAGAPNLRLTIRPVAGDYSEQIDRPQLNLLILPEEAADLQARSARLFSDRLVCAVDEGHPEVGERLTQGTRMMALIPERLGRHFVAQAGIRLLDPPCPLAPLRLTMYWAPQAGHDPGRRRPEPKPGPSRGPDRRRDDLQRRQRAGCPVLRDEPWHRAVQGQGLLHSDGALRPDHGRSRRVGGRPFGPGQRRDLGGRNY